MQYMTIVRSEAPDRYSAQAISFLEIRAVAVSAVSVEEVLRGRLALLGRRLDGPRRVHAYAKVLESVRFFNAIPVVPFDPGTEDRFQQVTALRTRFSTQDPQNRGYCESISPAPPPGSRHRIAL